MTDAELQALDVGTIVYHQHGARIDQLVWDGKPGWFNDPATGAMIYELHDRCDEVITTCVSAARLHKTAEAATGSPAVKRSMPTDEQLEPIARRYCELMGEDPDEKVLDGDAWYQRRWVMALPIVRQQAALSIAFEGQ
jgi:hypothetical protein